MTETTSNLTLTDSQHQFVNALKDQGRANATILAYGKDIEQLIAFCAEKQLTMPKQVTHQVIEDFKTSLKNKGYTLKSISRKLNSIKSFFRFLKNQNFITDNPASDISHPKIELNPPRILTKIEYRALRDACRHDDRISAIVEVLLQTGIRISELANLTLEDIDPTHTKITIRSEQPHESRSVPLNNSAAKSLEAYLVLRPKTNTKNLFVTKTGRPFLIRNIRAAIDRYFKLAGIENAKVNDLRHTFIAEQLAAGTPLVYVSKLVGHKRLTTTEKYLKFIDSKLEKNEIKLQEL
jgi:site-specific recombinase XerD